MMDEFLAQVYGTDELTKEAQEQNQAVQELYGAFESGVEELCKQGGLDPNQLTEQDMAEMWDGFVEKVAEDAEGQEKYASLSKEAWDQADSMGRIAAHAYIDELSKVAGKDPGAIRKAFGHLSSAWKTPRDVGKKDIYRVFRAGEKAGKSGGDVNKAMRDAAADIMEKNKGRSPWGRRAAMVGAGAMPVAGAGGVAYGAKKYYEGGKKKAASLGIPEEYVYGHAYEMLKNAGWVFDTGEVMPPEYGMQLMKAAQDEETEEEKKKREEEEPEEEEKEAALTAAALEHLAEAGYPINYGG